MKYLFIFISYIVSPKFCIDCAHFIPHRADNQFGTCKLFPITPIDDTYLVSGKIKEEEIQYNFCSIARKYSDMCGQPGKKI